MAYAPNIAELSPEQLVDEADGRLAAAVSVPVADCLVVYVANREAAVGQPSRQLAGELRTTELVSCLGIVAEGAVVPDIGLQSL